MIRNLKKRGKVKAGWYTNNDYFKYAFEVDWKVLWLEKQIFIYQYKPWLDKIISYLTWQGDSCWFLLLLPYQGCKFHNYTELKVYLKVQRYPNHELETSIQSQSSYLKANIRIFFIFLKRTQIILKIVQQFFRFPVMPGTIRILKYVLDCFKFVENPRLFSYLRKRQLDKLFFNDRQRPAIL